MPSAKDVLALMHPDHSPAKTTLKLAIFLPVLALWANTAEALGLGELTVRSRLGASFQAEVRLIESAGDTRLSGECFRLSASGESDSGIPSLTRGRISVERQNGQSRLIITSDQTINEPVLQINLRASCGSELVRSYTTLIDPASPQQLAGQTGVSLPPANKSPAPEIPAASLTSGNSYPDSWQAAPGETAQSIARALFPRQPSTQRRFLAALQAKNPQVDLGPGGKTPLDGGTVLNVLDTRRRAPSPPASDVEKHASKDAVPGAPPAPARRKKKVVQKAAGRMVDRLVISGPDQHDPWATEDTSEALPQRKAPSVVPDIVLDEAPPTAPGVIDDVKQELPVKHMEVDESGDWSTMIELADIMVCFGRIKGATQALEEFLARDPGTALVPWLKLLEIYRTNDMREDFEAYSIKLRAHFNVAPASWEMAGECITQPLAPLDEKGLSIEELLQKLPTIGELPHIMDNIRNSWDSPDGLTYLRHLLRDTRDGKRSGFPLAIARELQFLVDLLETRSLIKM